MAVLILSFPEESASATWRLGGIDQPWQLQPVSSDLDISSKKFKPDYIWGGAYAVEVVVDDDGDGKIDEDPVERLDDDGDGFYNEDLADGLDNDLDGLVDEDGVDPQRDNDGDGLINEDGLMTGGAIFEARLRAEPPWATREKTGEWGDDDRDASVNEDPVNGADDDGDGLIDEDDTAAEMPRGGTWSRRVYQYDVSQVQDLDERKSLRFEFEESRNAFRAVRAHGDSVMAELRNLRLTPTDWVRPIRLDSTRNLAALVEDRFLNGQFAKEPIDTGPYTGTYKSTPVRSGDRHIGMAFDNNRATARFEPGGGDLGSRYINIEFRGLFLIDRLRLYPRSQFPNRVLTHFRTFVAGDEPGDIYVVWRGDILTESLNPTRFLLPEQIDKKLPLIKDFRLDGGELGPPQRARVVSIKTTLPTVAESYYATAAWEVAELEIYGRGFAMDASFVSEIIDVGASQYRRYFDDDGQPVLFESLLRDPDAQMRSFDPDLPGQPVNWGQVRWKGQVEGDHANVSIRVRTGTTPDTRVYQRPVAQGIVSEFDTSGEPIDVVAYLSMSQPNRVPVELLPYNGLKNDDDGRLVGWTPWSAPLDFRSGLVDEDGKGGVDIPVSVLSRYIQFRFDFQNDENSGVALDYIEVDFNKPHVNGSVLAEIFPDTARLGVSSDFQYAIKPMFTEDGEGGFNRIDIAVPSLEAGIDSLLVDNLPWTRLQPEVPEELDLSEIWRRAYIDSMQHERAWLDGLDISADRTFASAVYANNNGGVTLSIKTRRLLSEDFKLGEVMQVRFHSPVFKLFTEFKSWVWDDSIVSTTKQPSRAGNAASFFPTDAIGVVALEDPEVAKLVAPPRVFTPNGDGINDTASFELELFLLSAPVEVKIEIHNLSGKRIATLGPEQRSAGRYELIWDGRSAGNELVPPGLYLYRLVVDTDARGGNSLGAIAVVY